MGVSRPAREWRAARNTAYLLSTLTCPFLGVFGNFSVLFMADWTFCAFPRQIWPFFGPSLARF